MNFYTMPDHANTTMKKEHLQETLLATDGFIMACGRMFDIKAEHIAADVYKVRLSPQ